MANMKKQSKRKYHIVYQTTNTINNMIYIGAHSTDLLEDGYLGSGHRLILAIEKYGIKSFQRKILYTFDTPAAMFSKEANIVNDEFLKRSDVYNIVEGGFGGYNKGTTGLKHLHHPISGKRCAVHPNAVDKMLQEGWKLGFLKAWNAGKMYVHRDNKKKVIDSSDLDIFLSKGWQKGLPKSPTQGKVWIYNSKSCKYSLCDPSFIPVGWVKKKWAPIKKGAAWVNNGVDNLRIDKIDLDSYISNGWKKGMITSRWK